MKLFKKIFSQKGDINPNLEETLQIERYKDDLYAEINTDFIKYL